MFVHVYIFKTSHFIPLIYRSKIKLYSHELDYLLWEFTRVTNHLSSSSVWYVYDIIISVIEWWIKVFRKIHYIHVYKVASLINQGRCSPKYSSETYEIHPISRPHGKHMTCLSWVYLLLPSLFCMLCNVAMVHVTTAWPRSCRYKRQCWHGMTKVTYKLILYYSNNTSQVAMIKFRGR